MALTKVTGQVIKNTTDVTVGVLTVTNTLAVGGTVSIGGTLTYEDVTNVDAVGLVTARNGIVVGSGITLSKDGDIFATGVTTTGSLVSSGAISGTTGTFSGDVTTSGGDLTVTGTNPIIHLTDTDDNSDYQLNVNGGVFQVYDYTNTAGRLLIASDGTVSVPNDLSLADKIIHTGDTDTAIRFPAANNVSIETAGVERVEITGTEVVFNDTGADTDFRIEGDGDANLFKLDAGNDRIGIGEASPDLKLHVRNDNSAAVKIGGEGGSAYYLEIGQLSSSSSPGFNATGSGAAMLFQMGGSEKFRIGPSGQFGLSGTNYGTSGQVLTSQGNSATPTWTTVSGTTINNNANNKVITGSDTANTLEAETYLFQSGASLSICTNSPAYSANLHVRNSYASMRMDSDGSNNHTTFSQVTGTGKENRFYFGDAADDDVGQIVYDHNGDQLKFVVGASERMRLDADGLTFNGDTAAANSLNDYEEGTFNASYYWSGSDANADGKYTKIGNRVIISIFEFAGGGQGLNDKDITYISGLPFSAHTQPNSTGVIVRYSGGDHQTIGAGEFCYLAQGGTRIKFDDTFNSGNGNWTLSLVYETTA